MASREQALVRSLQRGLRLINAVGEMGPANAKQLARRTDMPLPTAYHLLRTLVHDQYVMRLDDGSYVLGERLGRFRGTSAMPAVPALLDRSA
jgi:DNA-binding IclR family transcriptional regulator